MNAKIDSVAPNNTLPMMLALLLVACATQQALKNSAIPRSGNVAMAAVQEADDQRYSVADDFRWDWPLPNEENAQPTYPPELLAENLPPVTVRVRVVVDEHGVVTSSTALEAPPNYPQFFAAVQAVTGGWKYSPLVRWKPGDGRTEISYDDMTVSYWGPAEALPFHQDYDITFTQKDGRGVVTSAAPSATPTR